MGQVAYGFKIARRHGGNHALCHPCSASALAHGAPVGIKLGGIKVAVRVNPKHEAQRTKPEEAGLA
jgi:hypothetical protein